MIMYVTCTHTHIYRMRNDNQLFIELQDSFGLNTEASPCNPNGSNRTVDISASFHIHTLFTYVSK